MQPLSPFPPSEGLQTTFPVWYSGTQIFVHIHWVKCKSNLAVFPYMPVLKISVSFVLLPTLFLYALCLHCLSATKLLQGSAFVPNFRLIQ